jgi:hypothetical protein
MPPKRLPEVALIPDFLHLDWADLVTTLQGSPTLTATRTLLPPPHLSFTSTPLPGLTVTEWQTLAQTQPQKFQLIANLTQAIRATTVKPPALQLKKPDLSHKQRIAKMKCKTKKVL